MPCRTIDLGDGAVAIVCTRGGRRPTPCSVPGCDRPHEALCDYPVGKAGKTCDAKLCGAHRQRRGPDRDLCPPHARAAEAQPELPGLPDLSWWEEEA